VTCPADSSSERTEQLHEEAHVRAKPLMAGSLSVKMTAGATRKQSLKHSQVNCKDSSVSSKSRLTARNLVAYVLSTVTQRASFSPALLVPCCGARDDARQRETRRPGEAAPQRPPRDKPAACQSNAPWCRAT